MPLSSRSPTLSMVHCHLMDLSLIIPCHNEAGNIHPFAERILECMDGADAPQTLELIFVDDGSSDDTFEKVLELIEDKRIRTSPSKG